MSGWLKMTPSLETRLKMIDQLEDAKFRALINHFCTTVLSSRSGNLFTPDEEKKILASLETKKETLRILVDTIQYVYLQAAYGMVKPSAMEALMKQTFPVSTEKITIFTNAWATHAKLFVESLRRKPVFPVQVDDVHCKLNVQSSSSAIAHQTNPVVWLQLGLTESEGISHLTVELDRNDLTTVYNKFEDIQGQLDQLEWVPERTLS